MWSNKSSRPKRGRVGGNRFTWPRVEPETISRSGQAASGNPISPTRLCPVGCIALPSDAERQIAAPPLSEPKASRLRRDARPRDVTLPVKDRGATWMATRSRCRNKRRSTRIMMSDDCYPTARTPPTVRRPMRDQILTLSPIPERHRVRRRLCGDNPDRPRRAGRRVCCRSIRPSDSTESEPPQQRRLPLSRHGRTGTVGREILLRPRRRTMHSSRPRRHLREQQVQLQPSRLRPAS